MAHIYKTINLIGATFAAWMVSLAPVGKIAQGASLTLSISCGIAAINESRKMIFLEAQEKAIAIIEEELAATELELIAEAKVNTLQQQYEPNIREEINESLNHIFFRGGEGEPITPDSSSGESDSFPQFEENGGTFTRFHLSPGSAKEFIEILRTEQGWNQTQIIEHLWGVKKGGSERYKKAIAEYKRICGG